MKKLLLAVAVALSVPALANAMGISTGAVTGSYYRVANDIKAVCPELKINVHPSDGSLNNIARILKDPDTQYGIVQLDALRYKEIENEAAMKKIKMVFPFYLEEIHLIANSKSGISKIEDLKGKRVAVGVANSGNWVTSATIKDLTHIQWVDVESKPQEALTSLLLGNIDAMFYVAGAPVDALKEIGADAKDRLRLVSVSHPALNDFYRKSEIVDTAYKWSPKTISTLAVPSVLATYDYGGPTRTNEIASLVSCIVNKMDMLQSSKDFHPKWREIDPLDLNQINWAVHPTAKKVVSGYKRKLSK